MANLQVYIRSVLFAPLIAFALFAPQFHAQIVGGTIVGAIHDSNGAAGAWRLP